MRSTLSLLLCTALLCAQEKPGGKQPAAPTVYENAPLGLRFQPVYGWTYEASEGSGAWTTLVKSSEPAYGAAVLLQVSNNPYRSLEALRSGLEAEFAASSGGEPAPGKTLYRDMTMREAQMKEGSRLAGFEVAAVALLVDAEGKKRENQILVRTYFGANRLYRVHCSAGRSRYKKVEDLFRLALEQLTIRAAEERAAAGIEFSSQRGRYDCLVPDGYRTVLPPANSTVDIRLESAKEGLSLQVYSYALEGDHLAHLEQVRQFYGEELQVDGEEVDLLGGKGFRAHVLKGDIVTHMAGIVREGRAYRIHAIAPKGKDEAAKGLLDLFLRGFKVAKG